MKRLIPLLLLLLAVPLRAEVLQTRVSYLSAEFIYIQAGEKDGVAAGDSVLVQRNGATITRLTVSRVSNSFSACTLPPGFAVKLQIGDAAAVSIHRLQVESTPDTSAQIETTSTLTPGRKRSGASVQSDLTPKVRGRIGLGVLYTDDREIDNRDSNEPTLSMRATIENLLVPNATLDIRMRVRRTNRQGWTSALNDRKWTNRIYQVMLRYENPDQRLAWSAGRILSRDVAGLGVMDGLTAAWQASDEIRVGVFAGTVPDPVTSALLADETQSGGFVSWERNGQKNRAAATLAGIGRYTKGQISRESVYQQANWSSGYHLFIFQSSEIDINRGWRRDRAGSSLQLSSFLFQLRWNPVEALSLESGYDNRKLVSTWETHDTPDSLFDDAMRQGWRTSLRWKGPLRTTWTLGGSIRTRSGDAASTTAYNGGVSIMNILGSRVDGSLLFRMFDNTYTRGSQPSLYLSRRFGSYVRLHGRAGESVYTLAVDGSSSSYLWYGAGCEVEVSRHLFLMGDLEWYRGDGSNMNRYSVEAGWRF